MTRPILTVSWAAALPAAVAAIAIARVAAAKYERRKAFLKKNMAFPRENSFIANIERPGAGYCKRRLCRRRRPPALAQPLVEILADGSHQRLDLAVEEMIGAGDDLLLDDDAFLRLEFFNEVGDVARRHHRVLVAVDDQAGGRAGRQEREVVEIGRRRDRDETLDLRPAHQKLHADPGAEREACDPAAARLGVDGLRPVKRCCGIRQFADAVIEAALAAAYAAEVEAQRGKAAMHEGIVDLVDDRMVHRAAELRMRMEHDADRRVFLPRRVVTAFDAASRSREDDLGHMFEPRLL